MLIFVRSKLTIFIHWFLCSIYTLMNLYHTSAFFFKSTFHVPLLPNSFVKCQLKSRSMTKQHLHSLSLVWGTGSWTLRLSFTSSEAKAMKDVSKEVCPDLKGQGDTCPMDDNPHLFNSHSAWPEVFLEFRQA